GVRRPPLPVLLDQEGRNFPEHQFGTDRLGKLIKGLLVRSARIRFDGCSLQEQLAGPLERYVLPLAADSSLTLQNRRALRHRDLLRRALRDIATQPYDVPLALVDKIEAPGFASL